MTETPIPLYERLRRNSDPPQFDEFDVPKEARATFYGAMGLWIEGGAHGFYLEPESKDGHTDPEEFVETIALRMSTLSNLYNGDEIQSPIESMMAGALVWLEMDWAGFPRHDFTTGPKDPFFVDDRPENLEYWITPQAAIDGCRVDFLMWFRRGRHVSGVAIECDGHAFHEKTKEQAARDKDRDRRILLSGFPVMRFTGSEIFRDVHRCVEQVQAALSDSLYRVSKDSGLF